MCNCKIAGLLHQVYEMDIKVTVAAIVLLVVIIVIVSAITLVIIKYVYIWYLLLILINSKIFVNRLLKYIRIYKGCTVLGHSPNCVIRN